MRLYIFIFLLIGVKLANAQINGIVINAPCLNVNDVIENCPRIWVAVNMHFFFDQNCEGEFSGETAWCHQYKPDYYPGCDFTAPNVHRIARTLIERTNAFADNMSDNVPWPNEQKHIGREPGTVKAQCFPIRFLLKDVYVHCAKTTDSRMSFFKNLERNETRELNIFVKNIPDSMSTSNGYTNYEANEIITEGVNWDGPAIIIHEFGHTNNVVHPWEEYGKAQVADTWDPSWEWDDDCNPKTPAKRKNTCWDDQPKVTRGTEKISVCPPPDCTNQHPCCGWELQTTNIMAYSGWASNGDYATISTGQLTVLINTLSRKFCNKIVSIAAPCDPPSAILYVPPKLSSDDLGYYMFEPGASMNCHEHRLSLYRMNGEKPALIDQSAWAPGTPATFYAEKKGKITYVPGLWYKLTLEVRNKCGDTASRSVMFEIPAKNK